MKLKYESYSFNESTTAMQISTSTVFDSRVRPDKTEQTWQITIGTKFLPTATKVVEEFGKAFEGVNAGVETFVKNNREFVEGLKSAAGYAKTIAEWALKIPGAFYSLGKGIGSVLGTSGDVFSAVTGISPESVLSSMGEDRGTEAFSAGIARQRARGVNLGDQMNQAADGAADAIEQGIKGELEKKNQARLQRVG